MGTTCPICRVFTENRKVRSDFQLHNIVKAYQAITSKAQRDKGSKERNADSVPCEHCLDEPQPAVKTCLVCEASLCQAHLSKHNAKASQQEHILVEVGADNAEGRRCPEHGKLLECYCPTEGMCICVLCSVAGAHKGHEVITMKEERDRQQAELSDSITQLQDSKTAIVTALQELQESENQIKTNTKTVTSKVKELFRNTKRELAEKEKKFLSNIQSTEEKQLALIAEEKKKMENRKQQAEQNVKALMKLKEQPDVFLFFKDLKLVKDRVASLDLCTESVRVEGVQLDQSMIAQYQTLTKQLMMQLDWVLEDVCV